MSKVFITLFLALAACNTGRVKAVPGWAERDVEKFASQLGYPNAKTVCVTGANYAVDDAASTAYCTVVMGDKPHLVFCDGQTNKCRLEN